MTNSERRQRGAQEIVSAREHLLAAAKALDEVPTCERALHTIRLEINSCDDALSELAFREGHSALATEREVLDRLDDATSDYQGAL